MNEVVKSPIVRRFNDSIIIAMERGTPLTDVLHRQVEEVRHAQRAAMLEKAGKAEIALMIPVVFLILPVSVLFALWPSYFALGQNMGF
jgi:tight adherence protein C